MKSVIAAPATEAAKRSVRDLMRRRTTFVWKRTELLHHLTCMPLVQGQAPVAKCQHRVRERWFEQLRPRFDEPMRKISAEADMYLIKEFDKGSKSLTVGVGGRVVLDDVDLMVRAALDGVGIAFTFEEQVAPLLAKQRLVRVLEDWCPPFPGYFVYYPSRRYQPPGLSALIEALRHRP